MPRSARKTSLESRSARAQLPMRRAPYFVKIAKGLRLGYCRGSAAGTWICRRYRGGGCYDTTALSPMTSPMLTAAKCSTSGRRKALLASGRRNSGLSMRAWSAADRTPLRTRCRTMSMRSAPRRDLPPSAPPNIFSTLRFFRNWGPSWSKSSPPTACCAGATASRPAPRRCVPSARPTDRPPAKSRTMMMPDVNAEAYP